MMVKSSVTNIARENALLEELADSVAELRAVRYRFQGREWSEATGLANFRMRWYDAVTGRWLSKDPIEHSTALFKKLGAANRTEAVAIALRKHLLKI